MNMLARAAGAGAILACVCGCPIIPPPVAEPCYERLTVGDRVEFTLVEPYTRDGSFVWEDLPESGMPSCGETDGLGVGTYVFRVVSDQSPGAGCLLYTVVPESALGDVDFSSPRFAGVGFTSVQVPYCGGYWRFFALRSTSLDRTPLGERAVEGALPPLRLQRYMSGCRSCFDEWVAEIRLLPSLDAGVTLDAGESVTDSGGS